MQTTTSVRILVSEVSQVGEARRVACGLADDLGLDERRMAEIGIIATEAASNLVQHTPGGQIVLRRVWRGDQPGVEILALDHGPGMANVSKCFTDGYSTAGTAGNGLGAIARLSSEFDIHSAPGVGTALWSRVWAEAAPPRQLMTEGGEEFEMGAVCLPVSGEQECGDAWAAQIKGGGMRLILADGLGHGPLAAEASQGALACFERRQDDAPEALMTAMHQALRPTRGAAAAIVDIHPNQVGFMGVGNIAGAVVKDQSTRNMVSHHGTVGHQLHRLHQFTYPWEGDALIVLHSDGLVSQWRLDSYAGLFSRHPGLIAGVLYRDFCRERDDVTVLVIRRRERTGA